MQSDFDQVNELFPRVYFNSTSLEFSSTLTSLKYTPNETILLGDISGKLHSIEIINNEPILINNIEVSPNFKITDISTNLSGNIFASCSFGVDDISLGDMDVETKKIKQCLTLPTRDRSHSISFLEDQRSKQSLLIIGGRRGIRIHDIESGSLYKKFESSSTFTSLHSWSGCMFLAGTLEGEVVLWDIRKPQSIACFGSKNSSGRAIFSVDQNARLLSLAIPDKSVEFYDLQSQKLIRKKKILEGSITNLGYSLKQRYLLASSDSSLKLLNLNEFSLSPLPFPSKNLSSPAKVTGLCWHPTKFQFATRSSDKTLRILHPVVSRDNC